MRFLKAGLINPHVIIAFLNVRRRNGQFPEMLGRQK